MTEEEPDNVVAIQDDKFIKLIHVMQLIGNAVEIREELKNVKDLNLDVTIRAYVLNEWFDALDKPLGELERLGR